MLCDDWILVFGQLIEHRVETWISAIPHCDRGISPQPASFCPTHGGPAESLFKFFAADFRQPVERRIHQPFARLKFCGSRSRGGLAIPGTHILTDIAPKDVPA